MVHLSSIHLVYSVQLFVLTASVLCWFFAYKVWHGMVPILKVKELTVAQKFDLFNIIKYSHV
jgi:hypothetical protein